VRRHRKKGSSSGYTSQRGRILKKNGRPFAKVRRRLRNGRGHALSPWGKKNETEGKRIGERIRPSALQKSSPSSSKNSPGQARGRTWGRVEVLSSEKGARVSRRPRSARKHLRRNGRKDRNGPGGRLRYPATTGRPRRLLSSRNWGGGWGGKKAGPKVTKGRDLDRSVEAKVTVYARIPVR